MREIKFRGKRKDNGDWVYGYYIVAGGMAFISTFGIREPVAVIPETVGQYTGLKDKNGNKIFEGDIYQFQFMQKIYKGVIVYKEELARFAIELEDLGGKWCEFPKQTDDINYFCKIIGNVHEEAQQ